MIRFLNVGNPVFLVSRRQVRPPARSKLVLVQDERFDADWDRLMDWEGVSISPLTVMETFGLEGLWTSSFKWADQPQPLFAADDLFHEHFNTGWIETNIAPAGELSVSGVAEYQQTLTADVSALEDTDGLPDASTYLYQWQHETSPDVFEDISGATSNTYTTDRYDMGKRVRFRLQYTDLLQNDTEVFSVATSVIPFTDIPVEGEPFIQNLTNPGQAAQQTEVLFANVSNVFDFNQPISDYSYQWFRETGLQSETYEEIAGATSQNYTVQADDIHPHIYYSSGRIKVRVQYTDNLGKLEEVFSATFPTVDSPFSGTPTIDLTLLDENGNPTTPTSIYDVNTRASVNLSTLQDQNNPLSHEYQWYAEVYGSPGTFLPISGATSADFDITSEYEARKLYVRVTTTDASGNVYVSQSAETDRVNSLPEGTPSIVGTFEVGQELTAIKSSLSDYDTDVVTVTKYYVFYRGDTVDGPWSIIQGQSTTPTYSVQTADINKYIRVRVSYTDSLGKVEQVFSTPILIVNSTPTGEPVITGTFKIGQTLSADTSGVSDVNQPLGAYSYQWFIKDPFGADTYSEISGATSSTYTVQFNDVHQDIKVEVSFTDSGGVTETVISEAIRVTDTDPTGIISTSVVEGGDPEVGKTLQADVSQVQDDNGVGAFSYQWYRADSYKSGSTNDPISGATSETYLIAPEDEGYQLYVVAEYTDLAPRNAQTYQFSSTRLGVSEGPTARFQFQSAAFVDNSGNGNNGTVYGNGITYNASDSSVYLSGDHIRIPGLYGSAYSTSQAHTKFSNGFTIALRINQSGGGYRGLVNTGHSWSDQARISSLDWRFSNSTNLGLTLNRYSGTITGASVSVPTNTWTHLVATYDNYTVRVYKNGVLASSSATRSSPVPIHNASGFNIGSSGPGVTEFINAHLADINIFDYAIDASTAQALYTSSSSYGYPGNTNAFVKSEVTGQPTISGRQTVDAILSSDVSAIADLNGLNTFSYQWLREGAAISGAASDTYTVQNADFGKNVSLRVSYTDLAGYAESTTSDPFSVVNYPPYGPVSISNATSPGNAPQVTHVVEADLSQMSDQNVIQPENVTYQWLSNNVEVQNGTGDAFKQYTVQPSDYGQSIVLKVSYTDDAGNVETPEIYGNLTSAGVTVVNSPSTGEVYILNAALEQASQEEQNAVITADPSALRDINEYGDLTPDSFTYQWRRNGSNISGQTGQSYSMQWMDKDDQITVAVSFTDDEGNVETTVSTNSVTLKNTPATGDVIITGEPRVGKTLTADPSSIEDPNYFGPISNYMDKITSYSSNHSTTGFSSFGGQRTIHHTRHQHGYVITETVYFPEVTRLWRVLSWVGGLYWNTTTIKYIKYLDANDVWQTITGAEAGITGAYWVARHYGSTSNNPWFAKAVQYQTTNGHGGSDGGRNYLHWYVLTDQTISDAASYQWHRDDGSGPVDIVGATESTYTLVEDDYAKNITCTVSYTDAHGSSESVTSSTPMLVDATGYPSIDGLDGDGAALVSGTLTANLSAMQDVQGFTNLVYHWEAKQLDDADYSVVSTGADQNTFVVPVGYDAAEIRVRVTYDDNDFATSNFVYVRSDMTGDLVMSGPASPDYYVGDVVLADARNIEDITGFPSNDQIAYEWYRGAELVSPQTQSVIYEQAITVTSNNAMSNHLVEVTLDTAALVSAGKMHSDSYVHFYDEAGNKIPYWFEGPANDTRSTYWLKMDLPSGSVNIVARYCADADFAKFSSDASVMGFAFFEDFENGLDNWERTGADDAFQVNLGGLSGLKTSGYLQSVTKYSSPIIARAVSITTNLPANGFTPLGFWNDRYDQVSILRDGSNIYYQNNNSGAGNAGSNFNSINVFTKDEIILTGTQALVRGYSPTTGYDSGFFAHTQGNKPLFLGMRGDLGQSSNYASTQESYVNQGYNTAWSYIHVRPYVAGLAVSVVLGAETSFVGSVYNVEPNDTGNDLHVVMSYTDLQGFSESVTSPTITVSNSPFSGAVSISGSPYTGETLTADTSRLSDADGIDGASYTYQWSANGQALAGETASTFAVTNAYVNQVITVDVAFADNTGAPGSATAPGVTILNTPSTGEPVLNGTPSVGEDLTIDMSSVADVDGPISNVTYAWYESTARNVLASRDTLIAGAESDTFTIPAGYEAKEVKALVSYDDTKGESRSKYAPALPAFPEQDLDFYIDAGSKDSYALGTTDVYDLTQDALAMTVASNEWSNINNGRLLSSTTKRALQNASRLHDLGNDFTISALAYIDLAKDNVFLSCMQYNSNSERYEGYMFYFDESQNRLSLRLGAPGVTNNNQGVYYFWSGDQITSSGFYLVSVAVQNYNSANPTVDFFVNGNLSGSRVFGDGTFHSAIYYDLWNQRVRQPLYADVSEPVLIGGMNNTGNVGYDDQNFDIGMLSVHRRALSDAEMAEMYSTFSDRITGSVSRKLIAAPPVGVPTISGTPQASSTLTADASGVTDANEIGSFGYSWYADGVQLGTGSTRTLTANEFNKQITVKAAYTDRAGYQHEVESAPVLVVNTPATGTVAISGTPEVGQELTAVTSALSDINGKPVNAEDFTYQWYVNDALVTTDAVHPIGLTDYSQLAHQAVDWTPLKFGNQVKLSADGTKMVVGAPDTDTASTHDNPASDERGGAVLIYGKEQDGSWSKISEFREHSWARIDFGAEVAISGDGNVVYAAATKPGFTYPQKYVLNEQGTYDLSGSLFGTVTAYARHIATTSSGSLAVLGTNAYYFKVEGSLEDGTPIDVQINNTDGSAGSFGEHVDISGDGATIVTVNTSLEEVIVYSLSGASWTESARLSVPGYPRSVLISRDGSTIFAGTNASELDAVYRKVGDSWVSESFSTGLQATYASLDIDGNTLVVSTNAKTYVFSRVSGVWVEQSSSSASAQGYPAVASGEVALGFGSLNQVFTATLGPAKNFYNVQSDDIFKDVKVAVSFTDNSGNAEGPFESPAVSIVNSEPQGTFQIQGGTNAGDLVYVDVSGITDANGVGNDWSFQWKSDGVAIPGATNADYALTNADPHVLTVDGSYTDQSGTREHLSSSNTILQEGFTISSYPYDIDGDMSNLPTARATAGRTDSHNNTNSVRSIDSNDQTIEMVGYYKAPSTGIRDFSASHIKSYLWIGDAAKKAVPSVSEALINSNISKEASVSLEAGKYYPVRFLSHKKAEDSPQVLTTTRTDSQTISNAHWAYELPAISSNQVVRNSTGVRYNFSIVDLPGGVRVSLYSPSGTSTTLWHPQTTSSYSISASWWNYAREDFAGEPANGVWWLRFTHDSYTASWSATIRHAGVRIYTEGVEGNSVLNHNGSYNGTNFYYSGRVAHNSWQEQDSPGGTVSISGSPGAGHTLSALLAGDWASESGHVYQWTLDGDDVYGETNSTFVVPGNKVGSSVGLRVGYFNASGAVSSAEATPVVITNSPPLGALTVTGDLYANSTLTVNPAFTDAEGIDEATRAYTWYRNDAVHATGTSYTTVVGDIDATFYVEASYTDNEGEAHTIASDPFTIVNAPPQGSVTIAGLFRAGETVTATVSGLDDADGVTANTTSYQWMRGAEEIAGATALSYELQVADIGELVKMEVRYTDDLGKAEVLSSNLNFVVGRPPVLDNPQADQEAFVGLPLSYTVPADTFSDPDGDALAYSASLADDSALPAWLSFDAPSRTFAGTPPDVLQTIDLKVVAADSEYSVSDEFALVIHARVSESFEDFEPPVVSGEAAPSTEEGNTAVASYSADKTVSWSVAGADAAFFSISTDGVLTFSNAPAYDAADADGNNVYEVTVKATDSSGNVGEQAVSVTILEAEVADPIVLDGLVFNVDASKASSYSGSGTTWTDMAGSGSVGTLVGDVAYSTDNSGVLDLDGSGDYIQIDDASLFDFSSDFSIEMAVKLDQIGQTNGATVLLSNDVVDNFQIHTASASGLTAVIAGSTAANASLSSSLVDRWALLSITVTNGAVAIYDNGALVGSGQANGSVDGSSLFLGVQTPSRTPFYAHFTDGKIGYFRAYNKGLSSAEVLQNFNAIKSRFGL